MEVLVFKTNVRSKKHINKVARTLDQFEDINRWNFDLHDKDKILRIETAELSAKVIESSLKQAGYYCEELI
jgi:tRNA G26 N,N-dimethylase Trm1